MEMRPGESPAPAKPAETKPEVPDVPAAADAPAQPDVPDVPAAADAPAQPDVPAAADAPAQPDVPAAADAPAQPAEPAQSAEPAQPDGQPAPALARAGVRRRTLIAGGIAAGAAAVIGGASFIISRVTRPEPGDVRWSYEGISTTPAVAGDTIYGTGGGVTALDAKTGDQRWNFSNNTVDMVNGADMPSFTPAVGSGLVYVAYQSPHVIALRAETGEVAWSYAVDEDQEFAASPVLDGDTVYAVSGTGPGRAGSILHAIDAARGTSRWTLPADGLLLSPPAVAGDLIYLSRSDPDRDSVLNDPAAAWLAVNKTTGIISFSLASGRNSLDNPAAVAAKDQVYLATHDKIAAVHAGSGRVLWQAAAPGPWTSSLTWGDVNADGRLFTTDNDGALYALDAARGQLDWSYPAETPLHAAPAFADDVLYAPAAGGELHVVVAVTGAQRTVYHAGTQDLTSTPALTTDSILVSDGHVLYAIAR